MESVLGKLHEFGGSYNGIINHWVERRLKFNQFKQCIFSKSENGSQTEPYSKSLLQSSWTIRVPTGADFKTVALVLNKDPFRPNTTLSSSKNTQQPIKIRRLQSLEYFQVHKKIVIQEEGFITYLQTICYRYLSSPAPTMVLHKYYLQGSISIYACSMETKSSWKLTEITFWRERHLWMM